jgi:hypothetical protein
MLYRIASTSISAQQRNEVACIAHKSLEFCERCRLWQQNCPAKPENSAAFLESKVLNSLFRSIHSKGALKPTHSICLRAF